MTEKSIKSLKNKKQHLKLKKPSNVQHQQQQSKVFESDSDISEPDNGKPRPKMDHRALNEISSEVTDLLATLKKEHGIDNDNDDHGMVETTSPSKKEKKKLLDQTKNKDKNKQQQQQQQQQQKKRAANAENALISEVKKLKVNNTVENKTAKKQQHQQAKSKKVNANQKVKPAIHTDDVKMELDDTNDNVNQAQGNSTKKKNKKNKNKKRPADTAAIAGATAANDDSDDDDIDATPPQAKKTKIVPKQNQKQKQKSNAVEKAEMKQISNGDNAGEQNSQDEANVKKEHHLKNAVPIYVGNLPNNIKRLKLVKLFRKFGKILAIRFRSNAGKSLFKTSLIKKAPFVIAFIYFDTREAAEASLTLNGTQVGDNVIVVDLDENKREKFSQPQQNTVVVGNLKYAVTEQILRKTFKCCGEIEHIRTIQGPEGCKGVAFIKFTKPESCELALKLHGTEILNREIRVERHSLKMKKNKEKMKIKKEKQQKSGKNKKNAAKGGEHNPMIKPKAGGDDDGAVHKMMGKKKKNKAKPVKEFMGTKSIDNKKISNQKKKKKNKLSAEKQMAKKVAPKSEKTASS